MTACSKQRAVDGLYNDAQILMKQEVPSLSFKEFGKHSMSRKTHMRGDSGACNVCSAPCSSCMHFSRVLMGSKTDEFSDETGRVNAASGYSINVGNASSISKLKECDSLQHTTSETSNLLSVNSNHDSFSENAESKVGEVNEDTISCVSRATDAHLVVNDRNRNVEQKNLSCSLASAGSVGYGDAHKSVLSEMIKKADTGSSAPKVKLPEGCGDLDSPLTKKPARDIATGRKLVSTMIRPKTEVETNDDGQDREDEDLKGKQNSKSTQSDEVADMKPLQAVSGDESDESDIVEHDVNVCDICGDAGREDMLATCSRCSDGAEHIYCMRKMLRRVPKGEWLCEECKFAGETENRKLGSEIEGKRMEKAILSKQFSNKRLAENIEVAPAAKRQALETRVGSPKPSSPKKMAALSRESSFKSMDKDRQRSAYQTHQSTNDISEAARSPSSGIRLPTAKSTLLKSNSFNTFNSKPKGKLVDDVSQNQKGSKEHASLDMKERATRRMGKSMSFKSPNSGRSHVSESKVKMLSSKFAQVQDLKGLKQGKERTIIERRNLSKLDHPSLSTANPLLSTPKIDPTPWGETGLLSISNNQDSKVIPPDGNLSTSSKTVSSLTRKGGETQIASASSTNGTCSSASEPKSNQTSSKDEPLSSYSRTNEKLRTNVDGTLEDVSPRSGDMTNESDKRRESSTRCRPTVTASLKGVSCPKCKEIGHSSEFCRVGSLQVPGAGASVSRKEDMQRGSRLKDAIQAALLRKPEICKKKRVLDPSEELSISNMDLSSEVISQDQSLVFNKLNNVMGAQGSRDAQAILGMSTFDSYKNTDVSNLKQLTVQPVDSLYSSKRADLSSVIPSLGKPAMKDLCSNASLSMSILVKTTAIPEYEYIWQGSFELHRGGNFLDLCGGIQAHLSTCASPNVLGVVNKFPNNVPLDEVCRLSVWPTQFHQSGAKEDNIALYFFAKDLESYERHYKSLLDAMIKNDLALKGYFDGVELLIFPSNQLPERSQRWNMLFFLWGVFRTRRAECVDSTEKTCVPNLSDSLDKDFPPIVRTFSKNPFVPRHLDESSASGKSCDLASASDARLQVGSAVSKDHGYKNTCPEEVPSGSKVNSVLQDSKVDSSTTNNKGLSGEVKWTSHALQEICLQESGLGTEIKSSSPETGKNSPSNGEKMHWVASVDGEDADTLKIPPVANQEVTVTGSVGEETIPYKKNRAGIAGGAQEVILDRVNIDRPKIEQEREWNKGNGYSETEVALLGGLRVNSFQSYNRKHPQTAILETAQIDAQRDSKKPKIDSSVLYGSSTCRAANAVDDGCVSHDDMGPCLLVEEKRSFQAYDEKVIPKELGTTERYFFPVDTQSVTDDSMAWKNFSSRNGDKSRDGLPSLELALGAERKAQSRGIRPFLGGLADEKDSHEEDKGLDAVVDEKDDVSASLSLSLSFPFSDKEEPVKPVLPDVNTSLLLFGRYPDK